LLKRAIGAAFEKRGARMRVNGGPALVSLSQRKLRAEAEGEKTAMRQCSRNPHHVNARVLTKAPTSGHRKVAPRVR
jgi:hypothetical protein